MSVVAGLSLAGVVDSSVVLGAFDGLSFEAFVATRLVPNLWTGDCVVMDNCSIHKDEARRGLRGSGHVWCICRPIRRTTRRLRTFGHS